MGKMDHQCHWDTLANPVAAVRVNRKTFRATGRYEQIEYGREMICADKARRTQSKSTDVLRGVQHKSFEVAESENSSWRTGA